MSRASGSFSSTQASELVRQKSGTQIACTQFPARWRGMGSVRGQWVDINSSKMNLEHLVSLPFLLTEWSTRPKRWSRSGPDGWPGKAILYRTSAAYPETEQVLEGFSGWDDNGRLGRCLEMPLHLELRARAVIPPHRENLCSYDPNTFRTCADFRFPST